MKKKDNSVIESENVTTPEPEIQDNTNQNEQSEVIPEPQYEESQYEQSQYVSPYFYDSQPQRRGNTLIYVLLSVIIIGMGIFAYFFFTSGNQKEHNIAENSLNEEVDSVEESKEVELEPAPVISEEEYVARFEDTDDSYGYPYGITIGEFEGSINDEWPIVMEVTNCSNSYIQGYIYYKNSVKKYGRNINTLMPFSGRIDGVNILLSVSVHNNPTYSEDWNLQIGPDLLYGTISTSEGKSWIVNINKAVS